MGTAGDRTGYKVFSINTTIRNPARNYDFLKVFERFDGIENTDTNLYLYYFDLIKNGIYKSIKVPNSIKVKWDNNLELSSSEVKAIIDNNPQAPGLKGRVMTQLRALKDQSLLFFEDTDKRSIKKIFISKLGKELLQHPENAQTIYTKIMLSMHAKNPCRTTMMNESIPFLNTLFTIREVNRIWKDLGNEPKGILMHEFGAFVLSMTDCNYKQTARDIINYRNKFKFEINQNYIEEYLKNKNILPFTFESIKRDYPDEVYRKFEMTGLITRHGKFNYVYINFSNYNIEKVNTILNDYNNYSFQEFNTQKEYFEFQEQTYIPWENNDIIRRQILEAKAKPLSVSLDPYKSLDEKENYLDTLFYNSALAKAVDKIELKSIYRELLILSGTCKEKSKYESISEPLRLEYLLALLLGKLYGTKGLVSNIIYNEEGLPLHCAVGGKCDISYHDVNGSYILEPTMQTGKNQQLNSETTNIVRHSKQEESKTGISYRVLMVAPRIHADVIDFFKYKIATDNAKILSLSIDKTVDLFNMSPSILKLNNQYDIEMLILTSSSNQEYADEVNSFRFDLKDVDVSKIHQTEATN